MHVTIAGADDIPIDTTSDLYRNLLAALHRFGDPYLPVRLDVRERLALVISANVRLDPDYHGRRWSRRFARALLDASASTARPGRRTLLLSEAIERRCRRSPGVAYVDVDVFDTISETGLLPGLDCFGREALNQRDSHRIEPRAVCDHGASSSPRSSPISRPRCRTH